MPLQANPNTRTKCLYSAVFLALIGTSTSSYAVNFGATSIQSAQHEPLSASIKVSNIDSNNFKVSLANSAIYKQMGLTSNANIHASFQATSPSSGRIVLTSSQPINDPYADIVLDIQNDKKKQFMPKTLLMPMGKNAHVKTPQVIASSNNVNLPKVNEQAPQQKTPVAPVVKPTTPTTTNNIQAQKPAITAPASSKTIPGGELAEATRKAFLADQAASKKAETNKKHSETLTAANSKPQTNSTPAKSASKPSSQPSTITGKSIPAKGSSQEPAIGKVPSDKILLDNKNTLQANKQSNTKQNNNGKATYIVQRNDNLWTIASEIAKQNKANVHTVMKQIQAKNPNAFVGGNASRLIANKTLVLPNYQTVPSQKSLEEAISARRASVAKGNHSSRGNQQAKSSRKSQNSKSVRSNHTAKSSNARKHTAPVKPAATASSKTKPRVSLVAPGSSSKSNSSNATGANNNSKLVSSLQNSRQSTAKHASRVRELNTQVSSYTQRIQLQNKKLAELETRLKQLRGK